MTQRLTPVTALLLTIPPLQVVGRWDAMDGARQGLLSDIRQSHAAERYQPQG